MMPKYLLISLALAVPLSSVALSECGGTPAVEICGNGLDDDNDGYTDCDDFDCQVENECEGNTTTCADNLDNDGNGYIDCDDFACSLNCETADLCGSEEATFETCTDGLDNDLNGFVDCEDWSCSSNTCADVRDYCYEVLTGQ